MQPKIMILVSRTHWRCVSCRLSNQHVVSIDQHLKTHHLDLLSVAKAASPSLPGEYKNGSHSDGETDFVHCYISQVRNTTDGENLLQNLQRVKKPGSPQLNKKSNKRNSVSKKSKIKSNNSKDKTENSLPESPADVSDVEPWGEFCSVQTRRATAVQSRHEAKTKQNEETQKNSETNRKMDRLKRKSRQHSQKIQMHSKKKRKLPSVQPGEDKDTEYEPPEKVKQDQNLKSPNDEVHTEGEMNRNTERGPKHKRVVTKRIASLKSTSDKRVVKNRAASLKSTSDKRVVKNRAASFKSTSDSTVITLPEGQTRKPGLGGKPVKRTFEVSEKEKKKLKDYYIGIQENCGSEKKESDANETAHCLRNAEGEDLNGGESAESSVTVYSESGNRHSSTDNTETTTLHTSRAEMFGVSADTADTSTDTSAKLLSTDECREEFLAANENRAEPLDTNKLLTANENGYNAPWNTNENVSSDLTTSGYRSRLLTPSENRPEALGLIDNSPGTSVMNATEPAAARTDVTDTSVALTAIHHQNENIHYQSNVLFPLQSNTANFSSMSHDFMQPDISSSHYRGYEYPLSVPASLQQGFDTGGNLYSHRPNSAISAYSACAADTHADVLPSYREAGMLQYNFNYNHNNATQDENSSSQQTRQAVPTTTESSQNEQVETSESGEWLKNKTKFSFASTKPTVNIQQPSQIFECSVCEAKFSTSEYLSDHVSEKTSQSVSQCKTCHRRFHSLHDLNLHVFGDHEKKKKPFCFECGEKFQTMETFEKHLYRHSHSSDPKLLDLEFHECQVCKVDMACKYAVIQKHYHHKHKSTTCLECFVRSELVILSDAASIKEHRQHHENFCNMCIQDFPSAESLESHYQNRACGILAEDGHGKLCEKCNQWCPNKAIVVLHHKEHKLQVMRDWRVEKWGVGISCVHCDKVLRNKRNLQRHIAQLHASSRSYRFHCEFCGKGVDSKSSLKDHIALRHLGIKRYICEFCHQRFACAPTLRRHVLKDHATDKQYVCEFCGEKFCEKFNLTRHMYIHTGSARFMCEQCGKGFHSSSEFKKHTSVHAEKREFVCQGCGQGYKRKEHLKRHITKCAKAVHHDSQVQSGSADFAPVQIGFC